MLSCIGITTSAVWSAAKAFQLSHVTISYIQSASVASLSVAAVFNALEAQHPQPTEVTQFPLPVTASATPSRWALKSYRDSADLTWAYLPPVAASLPTNLVNRSVLMANYTLRQCSDSKQLGRNFIVRLSGTYSPFTQQNHSDLGFWERKLCAVGKIDQRSVVLFKVFLAILPALTLCDPIWHVISRSGEVLSRTALPYLYYNETNNRCRVVQKSKITTT